MMIELERAFALRERAARLRALCDLQYDKYEGEVIPHLTVTALAAMEQSTALLELTAAFLVKAR